MPKPTNVKLFLSALLLSILACPPTTVFAADEGQRAVTKLLAQNTAPDGVVFELIGDGGDYLMTALTKVKTYKAHLQNKYPGLEIAVVSHGAEQFNLTKDNQVEAKEAHARVQQLVAADVPVHVCETHASWRGVMPEDFPNYITVSATGPSQIRQYQELGYTLVVID